MTSTNPNPKYDVVVIGSGPGGAAAAWQLASHKIKVLLLEAGPQYDPSQDYSANKATWQLDEFIEKAPGSAPYTFGPMQTLSTKWRDLRSWNQHSGLMNKRDQRMGYKYHHARGVGGSSLKFTAEAHRLNPKSMHMHREFGVAADWPVSYLQLLPFYQRAEWALGVSGPTYERLTPQSTKRLSPHPISFASQQLGIGAAKLGWSWQANSVAIPSKPHLGRPACNYCGQCAHGCVRQDKGSADIAFVKPALATGYCTLITHAQVTRIISGKNNKVSAVEYINHSGDKIQIPTNVLIVAAGAILTPRLLLLSKDQHSPNGLANESGLVGKNFMETLSWTSSALHPTRLDSFRGIPSDAICWDFNAPNSSKGIIGGFRLSPSALEANFAGPMAYALRVVPGWGKQHQQQMQRNIGHVLSASAIGESLPNPQSFIDLDPTQTDNNNDPIARINSHLPEREIIRLAVMAKKCRQLLKASGAKDIFEEYGTYDMFSSTHVFGTCRMGNDSSTSVVNQFGQSHRWHNLFICDASTFPSSGGGESPSLTISALALRCADHIASRINNNTL